MFQDFDLLSEAVARQGKLAKRSCVTHRPVSSQRSRIVIFVTAVAAAFSMRSGKIDKIVGDGVMAFVQGDIWPPATASTPAAARRQVGSTASNC